MRNSHQPRWTLMVDHHGRIVTVRPQYEAAKRLRGWIVVARESELLPFNPPRLTKEIAR